MYPNRTLCEVLSEMRACHKSRNFASLLGLVEEAQSMGNRMEAKLADKNDIECWTEQRTELHKEIKELKKIKKELGGKDEDIL